MDVTNHVATCPSCGTCPTCGRGPASVPANPYYPATPPIIPRPWWQTDTANTPVHLPNITVTYTNVSSQMGAFVPFPKE